MRPVLGSWSPGQNVVKQPTGVFLLSNHVNDLAEKGGNKDVLPEGSLDLAKVSKVLCHRACCDFTPGPLLEGLAPRIHPLLN